MILEAPKARESRDYRHMYAQENEPQTWEDLIGYLESQVEEDAQGFDGAFGRQVAVRLRNGEARLLRRILRFTCKSQQNKEPTSRLEPLTPAPATSLLAHVLARPSASGFQLVYAGFGGSGA
jgi:hypothetical protein